MGCGEPSYIFVWHQLSGIPRLDGSTIEFCRKSSTMIFKTLSGQVVPGETARRRCDIITSAPKMRPLCSSWRRLRFPFVRRAEADAGRSEEHTSELQSRFDLV